MHNSQEIDLPYWVKKVNKLYHDPKIKSWCNLPYPNHKQGCPMVGYKYGCPPNSPYITDIFDINKPIYFVFSEFNLDLHVKKMRQRHSTWTERQLRNCLYWQPKSRKEVSDRAKIAIQILKTNVHTSMPESLGVNVYRTCRSSGLKLDIIRNISICHHVIFLGFKLREK